MNRRQVRLVEMENKQLQTELSLLKSQVNPHFLFNTLNNLYGLILQDKTKKAAEITLRLSDLMRYLLETSKAEKVKLSNEIKFIHDYLEVEKIRIDKSSKVLFEVSGMEKREAAVAPMLFIPIVENIFKYGKLQKDDCATVSLAIQGNELFFEAMNTIDTNVAITLEKSGTGLESLRKRLDIVYPGRHSLHIVNDNKLFKVTLQITLQKDELYHC
ncbi:MAG TPA: histidine kinase [Flavobacterium sp.]